MPLFAPIPAKPAFGTVQPLLYSSDYITNKKAKLLTCNCVYTNDKNIKNIDYNLLLYKRRCINVNTGNFSEIVLTSEFVVGI